MRASTTIAAVVSLAGVASAATGFNYASTNGDGSGKTQADFEASFKAAQNLQGTNGKFSSARLYTMIQGGTASDVISAIPAAISTKTTLLLGLWASAGSAAFDLELKALKAAVDTYGDKLKDIVVGISIGSEDLYRITPTSQASSPNPGTEPSVLAGYIKKTRDLLKGTPLEGAQLGHVDTWTSWVNGSNSAVTEAVDWLGFDGYPYFQFNDDNGIENGKKLFDESLEKTKAAAKGKPVWITETGWPVSGKTYNKAVASVDNAEKYWQTVGCPLFDVDNVWWYLLADSGANPEFGLVKSLDSAPYYNLTCNASSTKSSSSSSPLSTSTGSSSATGTGSGSTATTTTTTTGSSGTTPPTGSKDSSATTTVTSGSSGPCTLLPGVAPGSSSNTSPSPTGSSSTGSSSSGSSPTGSTSGGSGNSIPSGSSGSIPPTGTSKNSTTSSVLPTGSGHGTTATTIPTSSAGRFASFGATVVALALAVAMI